MNNRAVEKSLTVKQLKENMPQQGKVEWLSIRPQRRKPLQIVSQVEVNTNGLEGDHYSGRSGKRGITLIQAEHISVIAALLHRDVINPAELRRNIVVSGINLQAFKNRSFKIGDVILKMTGLCHPCYRMEEVLGEGAYNAMTGHGGINASVMQAGTIKLQDNVELILLS